LTNSDRKHSSELSNPLKSNSTAAIIGATDPEIPDFSDTDSYEESSTILKLDSSVKHTFKFNVEVDPERIKDIDEVEVNQYSLFLFSQRIVVAILKSTSYCPIELRKFLKIIKDEVEAKLPGKSQKAMGSFLFLRFFCSAITVPDSYGLIKTRPSSAARRNLVLVAKLLQNLANEVRFGNKELFMSKFNDFIDTNIPKLADFYHRLTIIPTNIKPRTDIPEISFVTRVNSLASIYNQLFLHKDQIINTLVPADDLYMADLRKAIQDIIKANGDTIIAKKRNANTSKKSLSENERIVWQDL